ncbi:MAG: TonB family protein [Propionivibrio sp.]|uniref:energy transducer TonB n=1 Tax=Propionivibrio sp. TaxID=2212460 RepID=UPI001A5F4D5F|nr:TonB family protein [Propionivibrio sp.]MBL8414250.1 TonB family protein [Propionivibrio sp.]
MDRLLRYALLASIAVHVAAVAALYPRPWTPPPLPVIVATLQGPVAGLPEMAPVAPEPRAVAAAPKPAVPLPAPRRPAVLAVAAPTSSFTTSAPPVAAPEALPSAQASGVVAAATGPAVFEPPRFNAAYLANPPPPYPASARRRGIEGAVFIDARVGVGGEARELKLATSSGDTALDTAAMDAVRGWRFVPARRGEQAVEAWVRIPLVFRLN